MMKIFKVLLVIFFIIVLIFIVFFFILTRKQNAPRNYWEKISTDCAIEKRYHHLGDYEVEKKTYDAPKDEKDLNANHFVVWYPKKAGTYPLVVMVNGSGTPCNKYEAVFKHFASWGYVVIGNDYGTNWNGKHASETLDFAIHTKTIAEMIDPRKIAIGGHSQGGMGTFNAITEHENGRLYKVAFSLSPTNDDLAINLSWGFQLGNEKSYAFRLENIDIPMMIIAGTGPFDNDTVSPLQKMKEEYEAIHADKVMFRRGNNVDHGNILYDANGYVIAWLDLYLKNKQSNKNAFFTEQAEVKYNTRYQDFYSDLLKK